MKIHEYNQMMAYLTRPATPTETPDIRQKYKPGGLVSSPELRNVMTKAGITPSKTYFSNSMNSLGVERGGTKTATKNVQYVEPTKSELKSMKKIFDENQLKSVFHPAGAEAAEVRKKYAKKLIQEGKLNQLEIIEAVKDKFKYFGIAKGTLREIENETGLKIPSGRTGETSVQTIKRVNSVKDLHNSSKIKKIILRPNFNILKDLDELQIEAAKILKIEKSAAANKVGQLLQAYQGEDPTAAKQLGSISNELKTAADSITPGLRKGGYGGLGGQLARISNDRKAAKDLGKGEGFFSSLRKRINDEVSPIVKGGQTDEVKNIASSAKRNTSPYSVFVQGIKGTINKDKSYKVDRSMDVLEGQLQKTTNPEVREKLKNEFNKKVDNFTNDYNKNLKKGELPIRGLKVSFDEPSKTIKNKKALANYGNMYDEIYKQHGYSFKVPSDLKTIDEVPDFLKSNKGQKQLQALSTANRYYAKIPGITDLFVMAGSIPGDLAKKKYLMAGFKSLGVLATPLIAYGMYDDFNKGIPIAEALERNLIGTDLVKGTKEYMSLSPEGKEARDVVKQAEIRDQIDQDESMLDTDFDQPTVKSNFNLEEAAAKYKSEQDDFAENRIAQEGQTALNRKTGFQNLKDRVFGISLDDITKEYYNQGGRVGYADGPKDPKRRTVIKGLTALAALPVIGKYFKLAKSPKAAAAVETVMEKVSGMPEWFQPFVNKVLKMGDDVTDTAATAEREIVKRIDIEDATVDVHYNTATNDVRVEIAGGKNALNEPLEMQYKAPEVIEETGKKTKGEFSAVESKPQAVQIGPDDYDIEAGENVTNILDDLLSETDYLEGFATGKIRTPSQIKKAKNRTFHRENMKDNPGQYILEEDMGNFSSPDRKNYETITSLDEIEDLLTITKKKK